MFNPQTLPPPLLLLVMTPLTTPLNHETTSLTFPTPRTTMIYVSSISLPQTLPLANGKSSGENPPTQPPSTAKSVLKPKHPRKPSPLMVVTTWDYWVHSCWMSKLSNLTMLNLSSNLLNGEIPVELSSISGFGVFKRVYEPRFVWEAHAEGMCKGEKEKEDKVNNVDRRGSAWLMPFGVVLLWSPSTSAGSRGSSENRGPKLVMFNNKITYAETLEATRNFNEEKVLRKGRYGLVFKASFQDGMVLSIRRFVDGFSW
ncbi:LRR receptor-like serine/threonine-protein [Vigna angularis]|uniref:LRR receptor-like serine/threonine-protein n=1 Tax=Phaseolus angularis TaxID=3914 RepID=A0A8T0LCP9_PHAAN|nr:LRR receptor-like serine/threonine-protein [Vigna angularis]